MCNRKKHPSTNIASAKESLPFALKCFEKESLFGTHRTCKVSNLWHLWVYRLHEALGHVLDHVPLGDKLRDLLRACKRHEAHRKLCDERRDTLVDSGEDGIDKLRDITV